MAIAKVVNKNGSVTYYGIWRDIEGRQIKRALGPTKRDAETYLATIKIAQREQRLGIALPTRTPQPFAVYAEHWLSTYAAQHCKPSTQAGYRTACERYLVPAFGMTDIARITRSEVKAFVYKMLTSKSTSYVKSTLAPLVAMLNNALDDGLIPTNPALRILRGSRGDYVDREARVRALSREQLAHLLATCRAHVPALYPLLLTLARAGLRIGEAVALRWQDINWQESYLHIRQNWVDGHMGTPKSGKSRRVDMSDQLADTLHALHTERKTHTLAAGWGAVPEWVFVSSHGTLFDPDNFRRRGFRALREQAGLSDLHIHDLRHTFASLLLQQGESLVYVKEQMGHSSIRVTVDTYGHLIPGGNRQAVNKLDDVKEKANT